MFFSFSEHDVDGSMLKMLNNFERISQLIPKFKHQLLFLEEREKLFQKVDNGSISYCDPLSHTPAIPQTPILTLSNAQTAPAASVCSKSPTSIDSSTMDLSSTIPMDDSTNNQVTTAAGMPSSFPDIYKIPRLPNTLYKEIEAGNLKTFGPHCQGRQILIDAVVHDLIENYNLL